MAISSTGRLMTYLVCINVYFIIRFSINLTSKWDNVVVKPTFFFYQSDFIGLNNPFYRVPISKTLATRHRIHYQS